MKDGMPIVHEWTAFVALRPIGSQWQHNSSTMYRVVESLTFSLLDQDEKKMTIQSKNGESELTFKRAAWAQYELPLEINFVPELGL